MIVLRQGDITQQEVDVIVNAANSELGGGGGVDGAIHAAAGPLVMEECRKIGSCPTGQAVLTGAGLLNVQKIIHTAGPVWSGGNRGEAQLLRNCYENSFRLALKNNFKTIAFPAISTGVYGYPIREATRIALKTGKIFEKDFQEIRFICFSKEDIQIYREIWQELNPELSL
jgi:O-acetyl-ADP-ribose deacetylase (regulator of RNase III)